MRARGRAPAHGSHDGVGRAPARARPGPFQVFQISVMPGNDEVDPGFLKCRGATLAIVSS
jgi:hypothetical protein